MTKINLRQETQNFLIDGGLSTVAIACFSALANGDGWPPMLYGFGGIAAVTVLSRRWPWRRPGQRTPRWNRAVSTFNSIAPGHHDGGRLIKWHDRREPEPEEFQFFGRGLPIAIPESTFMRFVGIAWRRQSNSVNDTKFSMRWTGGGYQRIKINWVLSKAHFTRRVNPRFLDDEYYCCLYILSYARLVSGEPGQGTSGRLYGDVTHWSRSDYCRMARDRWLRKSSKK